MNDPISEMMNLLGADGEKMQLSMLAEKQLDILVKYMQILYYAHETEDEKLMDALTHKLRPALELVIENFDKQVQEYQKKHGEI